MPPLSAILSNLAGNFGINLNAKGSTAPVGNISKHSDTVNDVVEISPRALEAAKQQSAPQSRKAQPKPAQSEQDQRLLQKLQQSDRAVRAHEQAHIAAGGGLVRSGAVFSYQRGPDGKQYAIGGEVSIDTSPGRTPEETIAKAQTIRAAALAPADPSPQDRAVATQAVRLEAEARQESRQQRTKESSTDNAAVNKPAARNSHPALAVYEQTSNIESQLKPASSFNITA